MAIIDHLGLEVKVLVNGTQTTEYPDDDSDGQGDTFGADTASCYRYIESVDNAEFAIEVSTTAANPWLDSPNKIMDYELDIDGQEAVESRSVRQGKLCSKIEGVKDYKANPVTLRKFRFSSVCIVEDTDHARIHGDIKRASRLGLIQVRVYRATKVAGTESEGVDAAAHEISEGKLSLAAKALKGSALSHATVLSPAVMASGNRFHDVEYEETKDKPLAVFCFKYRSKAALQAEMIISDPRALTPPSFDRDSILRSGVHGPANELLDRLTLDEVRRLAQQSPSANGQVAKVKKEPNEASASDHPFKYVMVEGGKEATDLTDEL